MRTSFLKKRGPAAWFIAGIIPFYLFLSFSAAFCSFHQHGEEGVGQERHQASPGHSHDDHSSKNKENVCKYAQCFSSDLSITSIQHVVSLTLSEKTILFVSSSFIKEDARTHFLRGPPSFVSL
jgi:hypothetical protein